ncbi:MAG: hydrogenase large subunit [Crenarchaeota archaeon]|nr:hydrogenase large subunit [Thermoproteota archaeon]
MRDPPPGETLAALLRLAGLRDCREEGGGVVYCRAGAGEGIRAAARLHEDSGCRLTTCLAYDYRLVDGSFHVVYVFDCPRLGRYIDIDIAVSDSSIDSLAAVLETMQCKWCEWEIRDLYGIGFRGHPGRGRLVLPDSWPEDYHPLRKDAPSRPPRLERPARRRARGPGLPLGPYHPALHEPEYFELEVEGERVKGVRYRGFFVYRGIEKLAEDRFRAEQVPFLAERICGICGFVHSTTYCMAFERAVGIEVPERAKYLRSMLLEIERIHSHLLCTAVMLHAAGYDTGFMQLMAVREEVMSVAEELTGNRKTYSANTPGGVRIDPDDSLVREAVERVSRAAEKAVKLARSFLEVSEVYTRLEGVGVLGRRDAWRHGALGPVARASGIDVDVRRDHPYAAYGSLEFEVPVRDEGDCLARYLLRLDEVLESASILRQIARSIPRGPVVNRDYDYAELRVGQAASEAPRGECIHYVITGVSGRLWRWKVRAPSYNNIPLLELMLKGYLVADAPVIISSIDPCFSCTDRLIRVKRVG